MTLLDVPTPIPGELDPLELFELDDEPDNAALRDPGLHPGFQMFMAQLGSYLRMVDHAPRRINLLVSAYDLTTRNALQYLRGSVQNARSLFLDSGAISTLFAVKNNRLSVDEARSWIQRTDDVVMLAWQLHEWGAPPGVVAAMDLPMYPRLLEGVGLTIDQANEITHRNSVHLIECEIPPGWRRVFVSQGVSIDDHRRCLDGYARIGVLDEIEQGRAWLAVGGMAQERAKNRIHQVHRMVRTEHPTAHIHALGVTRVEALTPMVKRGWINSADSSSPAMKVRFNAHPLYRIEGPRPSFLCNALHATLALFYEAKIAKAVASWSTDDDLEQGELFE